MKIWLIYQSQSFFGRLAKWPIKLFSTYRYQNLTSWAQDQTNNSHNSTLQDQFEIYKLANLQIKSSKTIV